MLQSKDHSTNLFEQSRDIAEYYGFSSLGATLQEVSKLKGRKNVRLRTAKEGAMGEANRITLMEAYSNFDFSPLPHPLFIYHSEPLWKTMDRNFYGGDNAVQFSLEIIGTGKSVAEAILFKTAFTILREAGFNDLNVVINSLGDRESIARFSRDFAAYYKKKMNDVPSHCRNNNKKDVLKTLECAQNKCILLKEEAPKPIASLTEDSRRHFSEVLEYLESLAVPYRINHCLVGGKDFYTKTIFEIRSDGPNEKYLKKQFEPVIGKGGRFDDLTKKMWNRKEVPSVGISISMGGLGLKAPSTKKREEVKPTAYLIQLGFDAKLRCLDAIEILRQSRISVYQSLSRDQFSAQLAFTEKMEIPYTIIIGQKEALEGTSIVRNMATRSQETVPLLDLHRRLK